MTEPHFRLKTHVRDSALPSFKAKKLPTAGHFCWVCINILFLQKELISSQSFFLKLKIFMLILFPFLMHSVPFRKQPQQKFLRTYINKSIYACICVLMGIYLGVYARSGTPLHLEASNSFGVDATNSFKSRGEVQTRGGREIGGNFVWFKSGRKNDK